MIERIALVGNCQVGPINRALGFYSPNAEVSIITTDFPNFRSIDELIVALKEYDLVFCQAFNDGAIQGGNSTVISDFIPNVVHFPSIVFPAFHPDIVYVQIRQDDGSLVIFGSPVGDYHSSLVLYGFLSGFSPAQTARLFNEPLLRAVGFLDVWSDAQKELLASGHAASMPLDRELVMWSRQGCFMHSINHPRLFVLSDIALGLLKRVGMPFRKENPEPFVIDDLMLSIVWPVYPPIARALGCPGGYVFKKHAVNIFYDLERFILSSYELYSAVEKERLVCWRIDLWRSQPEVMDLMQHMAMN